jgi:hypothetical protein
MANVIVDSRPRRSLETIEAKRLRGDVCTKDVIETWLSYQRDKAIRDEEIDSIRLRIVDERLVAVHAQRWRPEVLLHAVARKFLDDVHLDCLCCRDVGIATGCVALFELGKSAPIERTRQLRVGLQRRTIIVDG